jgi:uncharacterized repeat protein (TIGR01451 family)
MLSASPLPHYDIGSPTLTDIWVDPAAGDDSNSGATRSQAVRTISEAWDRIPGGSSLGSTGYRIQLLPGRFTEDMMPTWWSDRHGTFQHPIILQAADGLGTVTLAGMDVNDVQYMYLLGLRLEAHGGDVVHFASCSHMLIRDSQLVGVGDLASYDCPQESLKVNQSQYVFVEDSDISGGWGDAVDFVATQYGHVIGSKIHGANDWVMYVKGGSAYLRVEGNEIYDGGNGGFSAGQGTGFEFMVAPWLNYEAYDVKFVNNVIHDTDGAGIGVNGGYNILMAYNTMYRVGRIDHVIEVVHGLRGCDGDTAQCSANLAAGGWGTATPGDDNQQPIPDRHVYIYNNIVYNPTGYQSQWQQFAIAEPATPAAGSNIPDPSRADDDLQIRGNIIWNGPVSLPLGIEGLSVALSEAQLRADNAINTVQPQLVDPAHDDFRPLPGGNVFSATTFTPPDFSWRDAPARPGTPPGDPSNAVATDRAGNPRTGAGVAGAYVATGALPVPSSAADLGIAVAGPATAIAGGNITYRVTVTNTGPNAAQNVTWTEPLPAGAVFVSQTQTDGPAFTLASGNDQVSDAIATLASGASATFTIVARVASGTARGATLIDSATVTAGTADPASDNNTATAATTVDTSADLAITVASSAATVFTGANVTYTIQVTNNGPSNAQKVLLSDTIPAGVRFVSATGPAGWTLLKPAAGTGTLTCSIPALASGASVRFTVVVCVNAGIPSGTAVANTPSVSSGTSDPAMANNTASARSTVKLTGAVLVTSTLNPAKTDLIVGGTAGNDQILVKPANNGRVAVVCNGISYGPLAMPTGRIVVHGWQGNDTIAVDPSIRVTAFLFGDEGDDSLTAGSGNSVLVGGAGGNMLVGGVGRNLLIGGGGASSLYGTPAGTKAGAAGGSILIGGATVYDENEAALNAILAEWCSGDSYQTRISRIRNGNLAVPGVALTMSLPTPTIPANNLVDRLYASGGMDWFWNVSGRSSMFKRDSNQLN